MTIFISNLRRIFKNKLQVLFIVIFPAIMLTFGSLFMFSSDNQKLNIGISDLDKTTYTAALTNSLDSKAKVIEVTEDQLRDDLINSKVDYVFLIEKGFTASLLRGEDVKAKGYYLKDSIKSIPVQQYVDSFIISSKRIAKAAGGDEQRFYEGMKLYNEAGLHLEFTVDTEIERQKSYAVMGMFLVVMLLTAVMYTTLILTDKENRTLFRTITAPISLRSYMFQTILSFLVVSVIQVSLIFIVIKGLMGIYMGDSIIKMYLLFFAAAVVSVSLGVAISSISKSVLQAAFSGLFIAFFMSILGGCWWENNLSSNLIRTIGKFTPVYWIMDGVEKLLKEQGSIGGNILIILLFAMVLFFLGNWRKEDIAK